jgi:hypothetical protein
LGLNSYDEEQEDGKSENDSLSEGEYTDEEGTVILLLATSKRCSGSFTCLLDYM